MRTSSLRNFIRQLDPLQALMFTAATAAVLVLILYPLLMMLQGSVRTSEGTLTGQYFAKLITNPALWTAIRNSLVVAFWASFLSIVVGSILAWAIARTDMPLRNLIRNLTIITLTTPPFLGAIAWIFLLGPGAGKINLLLKDLLGLQTAPVNIFSLGGITFVTFLYVYPFVVINTASTLDNMDTSLEEASRMLGASTWRTAWKITLPLVTPAILGGAILSFLESLALFGIPAVLGMSRGIFTLTTRIYHLFHYPPQFEQGAAMAVPLIAITAGLLIFQHLYLGRKQYVLISGKGAQFYRVRLGKWRWVLLAFCLAVVSLSIFIPYFMLGLISLSKVWGAAVSLNNLTWDNYDFILFHYKLSRVSTLNSLYLALLAATIAVGLALIVAIIAQRTAIMGRQILSFLVIVPFAIPGVAMAVAFLWAYVRPPFVLYGTVWILLVAYVARRIPLAYMNCTSGLKELNVELEEAVRTLGGSWLKTIRAVTIPLLKGSIVAGWLLVFIVSFRELSSSILLYSPNNEVIAVTVFTLFEEGEFEALSALSVLLLLFNLVGVYAARWTVGRGIMEAR